MAKKWKIVIILAVLAIIIFAVVYFWKKHKKAQEEATNTARMSQLPAGPRGSGIDPSKIKFDRSKIKPGVSVSRVPDSDLVRGNE